MLYGFGFRGFRRLYGDPQVLASLLKVNLIAGQNNSGKSNVLRVAEQAQQLQNKPPRGLTSLERHRRPHSSSPFGWATLRLCGKSSVLPTTWDREILSTWLQGCF
jgi:hypothetical protein